MYGGRDLMYSLLRLHKVGLGPLRGSLSTELSYVIVLRVGVRYIYEFGNTLTDFFSVYLRK